MLFNECYEKLKNHEVNGIRRIVWKNNSYITIDIYNSLIYNNDYKCLYCISQEDLEADDWTTI